MNDNAGIIEAWNTILFQKFLRFRHQLIDGLSAHSREVLSRGPFPAGARVLDVGCGFGDSTLTIARQVGPSGEGVGVDCAPNFVAAATDEARRTGITNAKYFVADVEREDLRGPYDHAFARFGTMFFTAPGAAMRNLRKALKPGGTFTQIVWRKREDNPWVHEAELRVKAIVPEVKHEQTSEVHCGPGPFSMAGPDMVSGLLKSAGYSRISFERHDAPIMVGKTVDDAIEFGMALGPAGEAIRLAGEAGARLKPEVSAALREVYTPHLGDRGVWMPSSAWFIRASA